MIPRLIFSVVKILVMARMGGRGDRAVASGSTWQRRRAGQSPNDQRSDVKNPNNPANQAAADNRSNQMNPNNPANQAAADNRSNQMNPNNPANLAAANNRSNQMNPNNPGYRSSGGSGRGGRRG